jgi:peptidoglycan/xylan/chitin deacetylase (PgdA/CDA1 family)
VRDLHLRSLLSQARRPLGALFVQLLPFALLQRVFPDPVLCLCYHMVSDGPVPHIHHYRFLNTKEFEQDLSYLEKRFDYIPYEQIVDRKIRPKSRGLNTSVCLTFDDGFVECISVVRPILLRRGATCIFFIVTDLIDNQSVFFETWVSLCVDAVLKCSTDEVNALVQDLGLEARLRVAEDTFANTVPRGMARHWCKFEKHVRPILIWLLMTEPRDAELLRQLCRRLHVDIDAYVERRRPYLSSKEILQLRSDGFTIGAHGCSHHRLQHLSEEQAEREIVDSCRIVHDLTGQPSVPFAFPYFGGGLDRRWLAGIRERYPFVGLYFDTQGQRRDKPVVVQRVFGERIEESGSMDRLLRRAWLRRFS